MTVAELIKGLKEVMPSFNFSVADPESLMTMRDLDNIISALGKKRVQKNDIPAGRILNRRQIAQWIDQVLNPFSMPVDWQGHF